MSSRAIRFLTTWIGTSVDALPASIFNLGTQLLLDSISTVLALYLALAFRFEFDFSRANTYLIWIPILVIARPLILWASRCYRSTWRHFHLADGLDLAAAATSLTLIVIAFRVVGRLAWSIKPLPYSVAITELCLFIALAGSLRILRRLSYAAVHRHSTPPKRALLVSDDGSISGAIRLIEPYRQVQLVGIITNDKRMHRRTIAGVPVIGSDRSLQEILVSYRADLLLMTSSGVKSTEEIVAKATEIGVQVHIVPTAGDLATDRVRVSRDLNMQEVMEKFQRLGTDPHAAVVSALHGKCVLVTGAGGSIGSEISRQVAFLPVSKLVLLDQDENSIFELMGQLKCACAEVVPCVGDIRDETLLQELFSEHVPDVVLHAAAYKHVPVMESNPCEAVLNNVTGTRQLVEIAERHHCERFVMISTDKAVHPTSVMGATKRAAELLVQQKALKRTGARRTQFACVRFGNVVGSRGSVVPIFLRQIRAGGPVTITHEEMTRYFMTIPQAVQLVLQAATLASNGDIYMLDMGDPIKIIEFARELIRMAGLRPDIDIPIRITGTRPGEKLHEQLWYEGSEVSETEFPSVFRVKARHVKDDVADEVAMLERAAAARMAPEELINLFFALPLDYQGERNRRISRAVQVPLREQAGDEDLKPLA